MKAKVLWHMKSVPSEGPLRVLDLLRRGLSLVSWVFFLFVMGWIGVGSRVLRFFLFPFPV